MKRIKEYPPELMNNPLAEYVGYHSAGWSGVIPLPPMKKSPPTKGVTGHKGIDLKPEELKDKIGNIAVRANVDMIGIDVDDYGSKTGGKALTELEERIGTLPATSYVSSREDGVSGIRVFRLRKPQVCIGELRDTEIVQRHHRVIVAQPCLRPKTGRNAVERRFEQCVGPDGILPSDELAKRGKGAKAVYYTMIKRGKGQKFDWALITARSVSAV